MSMAQQGDAEAMTAYNRLVESLPGLEDTLENALRESDPGVNIKVMLMFNEYSENVIVVAEDGEIIYDQVNGVGTAPTGVTTIVEVGEVPSEMQEFFDEVINAMENQQQQ